MFEDFCSWLPISHFIFWVICTDFLFLSIFHHRIDLVRLLPRCVPIFMTVIRALFVSLIAFSLFCRSLSLIVNFLSWDTIFLVRGHRFELFVLQVALSSLGIQLRLSCAFLLLLFALVQLFGVRVAVVQNHWFHRCRSWASSWEVAVREDATATDWTLQNRLKVSRCRSKAWKWWLSCRWGGTDWRRRSRWGLRYPKFTFWT